MRTLNLIIGILLMAVLVVADTAWTRPPSTGGGGGPDTNTHVAGSPPWLSNDTTTMYFNETYFNTSVPLLNYWTLSGSDIFYTDGHVGIGSEDPPAPLTLNDTSFTEIRLDSGSGNVDSAITLYNQGEKEYDFCFDDSAADEFKFIRGSGEPCAGKDIFTLTVSGLEMGTAMLYFDAPTRWYRLTPSSAGDNFFELDDIFVPIGITIVTINGGQQGQRITIICSEDQSEIIDESAALGANINLNDAAGDFDCNVVGIGSTLELIYFDDVTQGQWKWHEVSRSVN